MAKYNSEYTTGASVDAALDAGVSALGKFVYEPKGKNLIDESKLIIGYYNTELNIVNTTTASKKWRLTDYIRVNKGDIMSLSVASISTSKRVSYPFKYFLAFDNDKNKIDTTYASSISTPYVVPDGVSYIRYSYDASIYDKPMLELGATMTDYEEYVDDKVTLIDGCDYVREKDLDKITYRSVDNGVVISPLECKYAHLVNHIVDMDGTCYAMYISSVDGYTEQTIRKRKVPTICKFNITKPYDCTTPSYNDSVTDYGKTTKRYGIQSLQGIGDGDNAFYMLGSTLGYTYADLSDEDAEHFSSCSVRTCLLSKTDLSVTIISNCTINGNVFNASNLISSARSIDDTIKPLIKCNTIYLQSQSVVEDGVIYSVAIPRYTYDSSAKYVHPTIIIKSNNGIDWTVVTAFDTSTYAAESGMVVDNGYIYITTRDDNKLRKVKISDGSIEVIGNAPSVSSRPYGFKVNGKVLFAYNQINGGVALPSTEYHSPSRMGCSIYGMDGDNNMTHIVSMTSYSFGMNYPSLVARHNCITMMWHGNHRYLSDNTYTDDPRNSGDTVLSKPSQWSLNDVTFAFIPTDEIVKFAY